MKTLSSTIVALLITVSHALAAGAGNAADDMSLLTIFFMGFGAMIIVFQVVPAVILLCGMLKAVFAPADKNASAGSTGN
jgi:hypothetical protein